MVTTVIKNTDEVLSIRNSISIGVWLFLVIGTNRNIFLFGIMVVVLIAIIITTMIFNLIITVHLNLLTCKITNCKVYKHLF